MCNVVPMFPHLELKRTEKLCQKLVFGINIKQPGRTCIFGMSNVPSYWARLAPRNSGGHIEGDISNIDIFISYRSR